MNLRDDPHLHAAVARYAPANVYRHRMCAAPPTISVATHIIAPARSLKCSWFADVFRIFCALYHHYYLYLLLIYSLFLFVYLIFIAHNLFTVMTTLSSCDINTITSTCHPPFYTRHVTSINVSCTAALLSSINSRDDPHMHAVVARYAAANV